jgi:hypothetical protein
VLATSAKDIVGTWFGIEADGLYQQFNKDGTCQTALTPENLASQPNFKCSFRFEGTHLIMITEGHPIGLPSCPGTTSIYEVQLLSDGKIKFVKVQDSCRPRVKSTAQEHIRVR